MNWRVCDTTLQIMWNVVQIKTLYQYFSAQNCFVALFHSYLTYYLACEESINLLYSLSSDCTINCKSPKT